MTHKKLREVTAKNIPDELKQRAQWVTWRAEWDEKKAKWNKPPVNPKTGRNASSTNPVTWGTFQQAIDYYDKHKQNGCGGIGFVFTEADEFAGVDLDHCRDPETGEIEEWAQAIIEKLNSYSEVSPSNRGVKIFVKGKLLAGKKKGNIEAYNRGRYFTVTGGRINGVKS